MGGGDVTGHGEIRAISTVAMFPHWKVEINRWHQQAIGVEGLRRDSSHCERHKILPLVKQQKYCPRVRLRSVLNSSAERWSVTLLPCSALCFKITAASWGIKVLPPFDTIAERSQSTNQHVHYLGGRARLISNTHTSETKQKPDKLHVTFQLFKY